MRAMTRLVCILLLGGCVDEAAVDIDPFIDDGKADGGSKLHFVERHRTDVNEPSDLVLVAGRLHAVSDRDPMLYTISPNGDTTAKFDIGGHDHEGLTYEPSTDEFLVAEESDARIWRIDRTGSQSAIELPEALDGNSGIE